MLGLLGEGLGVETEKAEVELGLIQRIRRGGQHTGLESGEFLEECTCVQHKNSAVPIVVAAREIAHGDRVLGLFAEGVDSARRAFEIFDRVAAPDVPIPRVGLGRLDSEQNQPTGSCNGRGPVYG